MAFGSSPFGSTTFGGSANSVNEQVFFPYKLYAPDVLHESTVFFGGDSEFYEILTRRFGEPVAVEYKVYTSHGEGETPQLQVTIGGDGQTIIGAAPIIVVTAIVDGAVFGSGNLFDVVGRPYTQ